jgi:hypothetical protein
MDDPTVQPYLIKSKSFFNLQVAFTVSNQNLRNTGVFTFVYYFNNVIGYGCWNNSKSPIK